MKKIVIPFLLFCVAFACACVLLLQPLQLVRDGSTRLTVHVGKTVPLAGIAELEAATVVMCRRMSTSGFPLRTASKWWETPYRWSLS